MKLLYEKLTAKVSLCHQRNNVVFLVGGSKDLNHHLPLGEGLKTVVISVCDDYLSQFKDGMRFGDTEDYAIGSTDKLHIAIDLESIVEADGVTSLKPESTLKTMFSAFKVAMFIQDSARSLGRERLAGVSITDYNPIIED